MPDGVLHQLGHLGPNFSESDDFAFVAQAEASVIPQVGALTHAAYSDKTDFDFL